MLYGMNDERQHIIMAGANSFAPTMTGVKQRLQLID
jgi:hypothetical protein